MKLSWSWINMPKKSRQRGGSSSWPTRSERLIGQGKRPKVLTQELPSLPPSEFTPHPHGKKEGV